MRNIKDKIWLILKILLGSKLYEQLRAFWNLGYFPDIKNPKSFNERMMAKKLFVNMDQAISLSDKHEVVKYVQSKIGEKYITPVYYVGDNLNNVNWDDMPKSFVVKTTHSGGGEGNIFVRDKGKMNLDEVKNQTSKNLKKRFGLYTNEKWYTKIKPRVLIEELMLEKNGQVPADFKFFCFGGKCHYIQVDNDRFEKHTRNFYDPDWIPQDFSFLYKVGDVISEPDNLKEMLEVAEKLSEGFDFIRVDLYHYNNQIRFGELTFTPEAGWGTFSPRKIDYKMGELLGRFL